MGCGICSAPTLDHEVNNKMMDKPQAIHKVENIGLSYFYDADYDATDKQILDQLRDDMHKVNDEGLIYLIELRDALTTVLQQCTPAQINGILEAYNRTPEEVGDGQKLLSQIYQVVSAELDARPPNTSGREVME
jgi:hypothetical protein